MMDEHMFCTGSTSMNAKVFDRRTQKEVMNFGGAEVGGHGAPINTVKANPACPTTTFASGADDAIARLFDVRACKQMNSMEGSNSPEDYSITDMSFSKSGRALFVSYTVPVFWAWDVVSSARSSLVKAFVLLRRRAQDYDQYLTCSPLFFLFFQKSADLLNSLAGHKQQVAALRVSPDGKVLCTASWDATMGIWA
jgi:WD40 repeat protein